MAQVLDFFLPIVSLLVVIDFLIRLLLLPVIFFARLLAHPLEIALVRCSCGLRPRTRLNAALNANGVA